MPPKKRTTADASQPATKRASDRVNLYAEAKSTLVIGTGGLDTIVEELTYTLDEEIRTNCALHDRVAAALQDAPDRVGDVRKPDESYHETVSRAEEKLDRACELISDVLEDTSVRRWVVYLAALIEQEREPSPPSP